VSCLHLDDPTLEFVCLSVHRFIRLLASFLHIPTTFLQIESKSKAEEKGKPCGSVTSLYRKRTRVECQLRQQPGCWVELGIALTTALMSQEFCADKDDMDFLLLLSWVAFDSVHQGLRLGARRYWPPRAVYQFLG
jgi:hypothetical protein